MRGSEMAVVRDVPKTGLSLFTRRKPLRLLHFFPLMYGVAEESCKEAHAGYELRILPLLFPGVISRRWLSHSSLLRRGVDHPLEPTSVAWRDTIELSSMLLQFSAPMSNNESCLSIIAANQDINTQSCCG